MADEAPELVEGRTAFAARALEFVGDARGEVLLLSQNLDRRLYGDEAFTDVVQRFVLGSERARLRILLTQPQLAVAQAPRLVELGRRLPSRIEFREVPDEQAVAILAERLLVDERAVLSRELPESLEARCWRAAPLVARGYREAFFKVWNESPPARELRVLGI